MAKRLGWTFVIGGALGMLAQVVFDICQIVFTDPNFILSETLGSDTLVLMGIIGAILGGLGIYRHLNDRSNFGAGLPFSGFAFGIGEAMIGGWVKDKPDKFGLCTWRGLWMVIWFNVLVFASTFVVAAICYYLLGIHDSTAYLIQPGPAITGIASFPMAFIIGGIITCFYEFILIVTKIKFVKILAAAWVLGAILTPIGIMPWLSAMGGWGANVMIMNGGQILYGVAFMFYNGNPMAMTEFIILVVTIGGLFLTGWLCFGIHIAKFGHKPQDYKDKKVKAKDEAKIEAAEEKSTEPVVES